MCIHVYASMCVRACACVYVNECACARPRWQGEGEKRMWMHVDRYAVRSCESVIERIFRGCSWSTARVKYEHISYVTMLLYMLCVYVHMYVCIYVYVCTCVRMCARGCMCVSVCEYACALDSFFAGSPRVLVHVALRWFPSAYSAPH